MNALRAVGRAWTRVTDRLDNAPARAVVVALLAAAVWLAPAWWRLWLVASMLLIGRWVFHLLTDAVMWALYLLLVTPVGLLVRLADPLRLRRTGATTYWIPRDEPDETLDGARRQG